MSDDEEQQQPWAFLKPWFEKLRGRLRVCVDDGRSFECREDDCQRQSDRERVCLGGDTKNCWLRLQWRPKRVKRGLDKDTEHLRELRSVREALLLTCAFARVSYSVWVEKMQTIAQLKVPSGVEITRCEMPRRLEFDTRQFYGDAMMRERLWGAFWSHNEWSDAFTRDSTVLLKTVSQSRPQGRKEGVDQLCIPVRLRFSHDAGDPEDRTHVREMEALRRLMRTANELQTCTQATQAMLMQEDQQPPPQTIFVLNSLDLNLTSCHLHPDVFQAVQEFVSQCSVPIRSLSLPGCRWKSDEFDADAFQTQWRKLILTITGLADCSGAAIDHLRLGTIHGDDDVAGSLFSALAHTTTIQGVFIYVSSDTPPQRMLCWMVQAVLGKWSTSSVHTLSLDLPTITEDAVTAMASVVADKREDGLVQLWEMVTIKRVPPDARHTATTRGQIKHLATGTALSVYYGPGGQSILKSSWRHLWSPRQCGWTRHKASSTF